MTVGSTYERIENSLTRQSGKLGLVADTRAHYQNLRLRLLEQLLGTRMLVLNSDLGDEERRIAQQEPDSKTTKLFHGKAEIEN